MNLFKYLKPGLRKNSRRRTLLKMALNGYRLECSNFVVQFKTFIPSGILQRSNAYCVGGGSVVTNTPTQKKLKLFDQTDHYRFYNKAYKDKLKIVRFNIGEYDYRNHISDSKIFSYGLQRGEEIHLCQKK